MDFKSLMTKLEQIDKKQILNESVSKTNKSLPKVNLKENINMKSSIARALMQEFGVNEAESADDGIERNTPAVDSAGNPIKVASGGNLMSAGPGKRPGQYFPRDAVDASIDQADADAGAAAQASLDQQTMANLPSDDARSPDGSAGMNPSAYSNAETPELNIGQGSQSVPVQGGQSADPGYKPGDTIDTWREPSGTSQTTFTPPPTPPKPVVGAQSAQPKGMTPAVSAYAERLGLLTGGKPDPAKIKAFQQKQGIAADGIIGPQTIGQIISAGSGLQSGGAGGRTAAPPAAGAQSARPAGPATQANVRAVDNAVAAQQRASQPAPKRPTQVGAPSKAVQDWDAKYSTTHDPKTGQPLASPKKESLERTKDDQVLAMIRNIKI